MIEIARLYFLACELKPELPDYRLMSLITPKYRELIKSAATNGISSGIAGYEQLRAIYDAGKAIDIEPSNQEFKSLLSSMINSSLDQKEDYSIDDKMDLMTRLTAYYKSGKSTIPKVIRKFTDEPPEFLFFQSGFEPLDRVLVKGLVKGITTIVANAGVGKSYIALAIAAVWDGPVIYYEPENGEALTLTRIATMDKSNLENKEIHFGFYHSKEILEYVKDHADENLLVIMDSLSVVCGEGRDSNSGSLYVETYQDSIKMLEYCKHVLITTHLRRHSDGDTISAAGASSAIEKYSTAQIHLSKEGKLPDGCWQYRFFTPKYRAGESQVEVKFAFNYEEAKCMYIVEQPKFTNQLLEEMEEFV